MWDDGSKIFKELKGYPTDVESLERKIFKWAEDFR